MRRACKITLKHITKKKQNQINSLLAAYRTAVNYYIKTIWIEGGQLNQETLSKLKNSRLSERYKSNALKQALEITSSTKASSKTTGKQAGMPIFNGSAILDKKFITIEKGNKSYDLIIKLSTLNKGHRITIPTRKTRVLNKWLDKPLAELIQGCSLSEKHLILSIKLPDLPNKKEGTIIGIDIGINKLLSDSNGDHYGRDFKRIKDKILRKKLNSKGRKRAYRERENYINRTVNLLPFQLISVLGIELLKNMKKGKRRNRGKLFRKAIAPWTYRQVLNRIKLKSQENRVRLVEVNPANTSRICPACGRCDKDNRRGENFLCISCGHKADADTIGAQNILAKTLRTLGSVESPRLNRLAISDYS